MIAKRGRVLMHLYDVWLIEEAGLGYRKRGHADQSWVLADLKRQALRRLRRHGKLEIEEQLWDMEPSEGEFWA